MSASFCFKSMKALASFVSPSENVMTKLPDHLPVKSSADIRAGARSRTPPEKRNVRLSIVISFVMCMEPDTNWHTSRRPAWFQVSAASGSERSSHNRARLATARGTDLEQPNAQHSPAPRAPACDFRNSDQQLTGRRPQSASGSQRLL